MIEHYTGLNGFMYFPKELMQSVHNQLLLNFKLNDPILNVPLINNGTILLEKFEQHK